MKTALSILALFFLCNLSAQKNCATCWGQNDTVPTLTKEDKKALRLYSKLQWYDFSTYKFRGEGKRIVWISYAVAGALLHGPREAYNADKYVLQRVLGGPDDSWIGPMQWVRQYYDRNPELPHKPNIWNPLRDYYHFSGAATKTIWIGGAFTIGLSKQPIKYKILDLLIGTLITSGTASLTYNILR